MHTARVIVLISSGTFVSSSQIEAKQRQNFSLNPTPSANFSLPPPPPPSGTTFVLIVTYGAVVIGFVGVMLWFFLKQKSKLVVQWLPQLLPVFEALVRAEEYLRWPNGTPLLRDEIFGIREQWTFFAARRRARLFGRGTAHNARESVREVALSAAAKLEVMAAALRERFRGGDDDDDVEREPDLLNPAHSGSIRVETQNPIDRTAAAAAATTRPAEGVSEATASYEI